ncbi:MAG: hypothetical protein AAF993_11915 [Pseudomonadota bacterium]
MYPIAIVGNNVTAWAAWRACRLAGFDHVDVYHRPGEPLPHQSVVTLPACHSKVLQALNCGDDLLQAALAPDRQQTRLIQSAYLIAELPLGKFVHDRYQAPHLNIEYTALLTLLQGTQTTTEAPALAQLQRDYTLVLVTEPLEVQTTPSRCWYAEHARAESRTTANISWLGQDVWGWQLATAQKSHYFFVTADGNPPQAQSCHPSIQAAANSAEPIFNLVPPAAEVREHWYEGRVVYLGDACYPPSLFLREASCTGVEDAWVLSRMLENYEEDYADALQQYEYYRRPRARKILRAAQDQTTRANQPAIARRFLQHLNTALSSRFLPEIAMQRIDWLYGYDCIRGFR